MNSSGRQGSLILIGFMGSGKTTVGKILSDLSGLPFTDTDERIIEKTGLSINEIFEKYGEPYFRDLETQVLREMLLENTERVISVGGGLPVRPENRILLGKLGTVFYLQADPETLMTRLEQDRSRPLLRGGDLKEKIESLMAARESIYLETADHVIETGPCTKEEVARMILTEKS